MQIIDAMRQTDRIAKVLANLEHRPPDQLVPFKFEATDSQRVYEFSVAQARETLAGIGHGLTPPKMLADTLEGALNLFYPADGRNREALKYYRQREWRISGNYAINGEELMRLPSEAMIARLLALDANFFGRDFPPSDQRISNPTITDTSQKRLIDWVYVLPGQGGRHILELAHRIIVPEEAVEDARRALKPIKAPPPIIAQSSLTAPP